MSPQKQKRLISVNKKTLKRSHNSYSIEQKRQVVTYAKENGIIRVANTFELNKSIISRWVNSNEKWFKESN